MILKIENYLLFSLNIVRIEYLDTTDFYLFGSIERNYFIQF